MVVVLCPAVPRDGAASPGCLLSPPPVGGPGKQNRTKEQSGAAAGGSVALLGTEPVVKMTIGKAVVLKRVQRGTDTNGVR